VGSRCASRKRSTRCHAYGLRGSRSAFQRPPGTRESAGVMRIAALTSPPCAFRFPSEAHRNTPAPSRETEVSARQTMLPSLGFLAPRHMPGRRTRCPQGVLPCGVPRPRFGYLPRGVHHHPCGSLAAPERPRAFLFEAFSSRRSDSLSEVHALLPLRASIRLAPIGACGRDRLQGLDPGGSSFRPSRLAARRVDASLGFFPSERSPPLSLRALRGFAPAPPPRVGRD
jgi:hypothetical protein